MTLDEFGREHGLELAVDGPDGLGRYTVGFHGVMLVYEGRMYGAVASGNSANEARNRYCGIIRGQTISHLPQSPLSRREIQVPDDLHEPQPIDAELQPIGLRDRFAMAAMQGWLTTYPEDYRQQEVNVDVVATFAYRMADAMLKHREA